MKTTLLTIATCLFMLTATSKSFAVTYTELSWIRNFSKIEVHGNVQLHLLSGEKNKVEMNSTYYDHNALVQVENGVLRITCYRTERLDVWVTIDDLRELSAYDNVLVQTEGEFSSIDFSVALFNHAKADLNLDCFATDIKLNDHAMANVSGTAIESELTSNYAATLNATNFTADEIAMKRIAPVWETRIAFVDPNPLNDEPASIAAINPTIFDIPAGVNTIEITHSLIN